MQSGAEDMALGATIALVAGGVLATAGATLLVVGWLDDGSAHPDGDAGGHAAIRADADRARRARGVLKASFAIGLLGCGLVAGCVVADLASLNDKRCPCADGYVCDVERDLCVLSGSSDGTSGPSSTSSGAGDGGAGVGAAGGAGPTSTGSGRERRCRKRAGAGTGGSGGGGIVPVRRSLTIDSQQVVAPLVDFPLLVSVSSPQLAASAQADGDDIHFIDSDETTQLDHEIESWDPASGTLVAWVRIATLPASVDKVIYLHYGEPAAAPQANPEGVWMSSYRGVWHMNDQTADSIADSTQHQNHGPKRAAAEPLEAGGKIGRAQDFDGADDYINVGSDSSIDDIFASGGTLQAWIRHHGLGRRRLRSHRRQERQRRLGVLRQRHRSQQHGALRQAFQHDLRLLGLPGLFDIARPMATRRRDLRSQRHRQRPHRFISTGVLQTSLEFTTPAGSSVSDSAHPLWLGKPLRRHDANLLGPHRRATPVQHRPLGRLGANRVQQTKTIPQLSSALAPKKL